MFSDQLQEYIQIGMVAVDDSEKKATIHTPPRADDVADDEWQQVLQIINELKEELEKLGYTVNN